MTAPASIPRWLENRYEAEAKRLGLSPDELRVYEDLLAEEMDRAERAAWRGEPAPSPSRPAP